MKTSVRRELTELKARWIRVQQKGIKEGRVVFWLRRLQIRGWRQTRKTYTVSSISIVFHSASGDKTVQVITGKTKTGKSEALCLLCLRLTRGYSESHLSPMGKGW